MTTENPGTPPYGQQPPYFPPQQPPSGGQPPTGPYQWQQPGGQPPRPPRKSHRTRNIILSIVGAFVLIIVIVSVATAGNNPNAPASNAGAGAGQPATQVTDSVGETCSSFDAQGYCPGDDPSPSPSPSPAPPPPPPPSYNDVTDSQWQLISENPDGHTGETYTVYGTVTQHDANTGANEFRADAGPSDNPNTNTIFDGSGDGSQVAPLQVGQSFTAKVSVEGSLSYTLQAGGSTTVPELVVVSLVIG